MKFEDALKKLDGDSVGGDLIVHREGRNILVGKNVQGLFIVADSDEAKLIAAEIGVEVEASIEVVEADVPTTHELKVDDKVETKDQLNPPAPDPKSKK